MNLIENRRAREAALETDAREHLAFLQHLRSDLHQVQWLRLAAKNVVSNSLITYNAVGDECHDVGRDEALLVHPLSTVPPVLNYSHKCDRFEQVWVGGHLLSIWVGMLLPLLLLLINYYIGK